MINRWRGALLFLLSLLAACLVVWLLNDRHATPSVSSAVKASGTLAPDVLGSGLADKLKPGMRAWALHVTDVSGIAGFVMPGDRVDILVSRSGHRADVLAQSVRVLASAQDSDERRHGAKVASVITLEVAPELALKLAGLGSESSIGLVLRRSDEEVPRVAVPKRVTTPEKMQPSTPTRVEIIRGSQKESWEGIE